MFTVNNLANAVLHVETFPFFDIAHNFLAAVEVRNELDGNGRQFSRIHPFASWILTIAFIFSGSLTANLLLGEPVIAPLGNTKLLVVASVMWYLVFFAPSDIGYKAATSLPLRFLASMLNEIYRVRKVGNGILQASQIYPNSWIIMIAIATIRSNGSGLMKLLIRQMQKTQSPKDVGFMQLPLTTKISMMAAFLFILENKTSWLGSFELLYFGITLFFIYIKISSFFKVFNCLPLENQFYSIFFGNTCVNETELSDSNQKKKKNDLKKRN